MANLFQVVQALFTFFIDSLYFIEITGGMPHNAMGTMSGNIIYELSIVKTC